MCAFASIIAYLGFSSRELVLSHSMVLFHEVSYVTDFHIVKELFMHLLMHQFYKVLTDSLNFENKKRSSTQLRWTGSLFISGFRIETL